MKPEVGASCVTVGRGDGRSLVAEVEREAGSAPGAVSCGVPRPEAMS